jgi:hypothetical protein
VLSENLAKFNALLKYSRANWSLGLSAYANHWRSTDQIPERAVASGQIPLNGYIDPNDGGVRAASRSISTGISGGRPWRPMPSAAACA